MQKGGQQRKKSTNAILAVALKAKGAFIVYV
jgi:hypothetical protein